MNQDPDDAPEITDEMLENAHVFNGNKLIKRGKGRVPVFQKTIQTTIPDDLYDKLQAYRKANDRSEAWVAREALRMFFESNEKEL